MTKRVWSVVFCVIFLGASEVVLRIPLAEPQPVQQPQGIEASTDAPAAPLFFALGTSRTKRAIDPTRIESALAAAGVPDPCVINASYVGITNVHIYRLYMEEIRPVILRNPVRAVLAIEVRASGLNDAYMSTNEERWASTASLPPLEPTPGGASGSTTTQPDAARPADFIDHLAAARFDDAAKSLLWHLKIVQGRDESRQWWAQVRARWAGDAPADVVDEEPPAPAAAADTGPGSESTVDPAAIRSALAASRVGWAKGDPGFAPGERNRVNDSWQIDKWRKRYENELLEDFRLGGIQTAFLRRLIRQARSDGLITILYVMPVTAVHKTFFAPGLHDEIMDFVRALAVEENVRLVDFDTDHVYPDSAFQDTHHLGRSFLTRFNRQFAGDVFLRAYEGR